MYTEMFPEEIYSEKSHTSENNHFHLNVQKYSQKKFILKNHILLNPQKYLT